MESVEPLKEVEMRKKDFRVMMQMALGHNSVNCWGWNLSPGSVNAHLL